MSNDTTTNKRDCLENFLYSRCQDALQRQQLITYLIATGLVVVGMSMHFLHIIGAKDVVLLSISAFTLVSSLVLFALWLLRKFSLKTTYSIVAIIVQLMQSAKIVYISLELPEQSNYLILMNGIISMMLMTLLAISYMRISTFAVGGANAVTLITSSAIVQDRAQWQFVILIVLFTVFFMIMADMMYRNVKLLRDKDIQYKSDERMLLDVLRLNRREIRAYIEMCKTSGNSVDGEPDRLFAMLSERAQRNLIDTVNHKQAIDASRNERILAAFPMLTPMETNVARLVIRGLKLAQVCAATGKSEDNISVVRSRIRKKLGLKAGDDLREALRQGLDLE